MLVLLWDWHDYIDKYPPFKKLKDDPEFKAIIKRVQDEKVALRVQIKAMEERAELDL